MTPAPSVPDLLRRGASAPAHVSAVDAVMGEDWAHLELGRGGVARPAVDEGRRSGRQRRAAIGGALASHPQAMVKLIGRGGTATAGGLRAQMDYLARQGDVPLVSSESTFGAELSVADAAMLAAAWGLPETDRGGSDRSSHFVVSFPQGTDPAAAERAGRAWAAALFDSGDYGDRWDYYTAFHTDTAYPHIHVVVGRRGLDEGHWLRVSARSEIGFERLREVQVEVAAREGIALTGTSRLARGVHERPLPDAEFRRAREAGRAAVPPEHSEASAIITAAAILEFARDYQGAAAALRADAPALAERLEAAAATLLAGRALAAERDAAAHPTTEEARGMAETIEQVQAEVRQNFVELAAEIGQVRDPAQRAVFLRHLAGLKSEAAPMLRDDLDLQGYRAETLHRDYRGLPAVAGDARVSPQAVAIKAEADRAVAGLAERAGLRPEATLARYAGAGVSLGLGRDYRAEELAERAADRSARGAPIERDNAALARLAAFHRQAGAIYRTAAERLRELERAEARDAPGDDAGRDKAGEARAAPGAGAQRQTPDAGRSASSASRPDAPEAGRTDPPQPQRPTPRRRARDDDDRSR